MFFVGVEKLGAPKFLIGKKILLSGAAGGESKPLHVVSFADVVVGGVIEWRMSGSGGHDCGKMRR